MKLPHFIKSIYSFLRLNFVLIFILLVSIIFYLNLNSAIARFIDTYLQPIFGKSIVALLAFFANLVPVSCMELSFYSPVILVPLLAYFIIFKKYKAVQQFLRLVLIIAIIIIHWFYIEWGYRYYLPNQFAEIGNFEPSQEDFDYLKTELCTELAHYSVRPEKIAFKTIVPDLIKNIDVYIASFEHFGRQRTYIKLPRIKSFSLIPYAMKLFGFSGIYNPWLREVHIAKKMPFGFQIFTLIHELAHAKGITSEHEANVMAYEISRRSSNKQVRYSLLLEVALFLLPYFTTQERGLFLNNEIPSFAKEDIENYYVYWQDTIRPITKISNWLYDVYLKSSNIQEGRKSYGRLLSYMLYKKSIVLGH